MIETQICSLHADILFSLSSGIGTRRAIVSSSTVLSHQATFQPLPIG